MGRAAVVIVLLALGGCSVAAPPLGDEQATAEGLRLMAATPRATGCHLGPARPYPEARLCDEVPKP